MNELISIVVPVYNVEKYLSTCVESILKQTYSNIEVILVDDGSTDCSGKMCDHYMGQDERIKVDLLHYGENFFNKNKPLSYDKACLMSYTNELTVNWKGVYVDEAN